MVFVFNKAMNDVGRCAEDDLYDKGMLIDGLVIMRKKMMQIDEQE